ncbi:MAG: class I SAM-dependent methyltransferase [Gemmatimonadaceae bacterium]
MISYQSERYALVNSLAIEHRRHLHRVRRFLDPQPHERLLEVGCSRGFLTRLVQQLAPDTRGIDLNTEAIARGVTYGLAAMDAQRLAFDDESFDKAFSFHCIEHVADLGAALREMDRVLKPGGSLLLVYPAEPIRGLYVIPTAWMLFRNPLRARDLHLHRLSPRRLRPFLAGTSLETIESRIEFFLLPQFITLLRKAGAPVSSWAQKGQAVSAGASAAHCPPIARRDAGIS